MNIRPGEDESDNDKEVDEEVEIYNKWFRAINRVRRNIAIKRRRKKKGIYK